MDIKLWTKQHSAIMYPLLSGLVFGLVLVVFYFLSSNLPNSVIPIMLVTALINGIFVWKYKMPPLPTAVYFGLGSSLSSFAELFVYPWIFTTSFQSILSIFLLQVVSSFSLTFFPGVVAGLATSVIKKTDHR